jgi:ABC-2 type transport system ATP-binding protein
VAGLTRRYRGHLALDDVTVDVEGSSITGLLGRNGAGKSTFMLAEALLAEFELPAGRAIKKLSAACVRRSASSSGWPPRPR